MNEQNSYQVPDKSSSGSSGGACRAVEPGQGIEWFKEGWQIFVKNPGVWIAISAIMVVIFVILNFLPVVGQLAANLLAPAFGAGLLVGCRALEQGEELKVEQLFAGFQRQTGSLILLGVLALVASVVIGVISFGVIGGSAATGAAIGDGAGMGMAMGGFLLAMLLVLILSVPLAMALWFAPALVVFRGLAPLDAAKASFNACVKNVVPFLIYGFLLFVAFIVAALPFGLGFILLLPVAAGSIYAAYMDIFERS
ncbi:MAG: BPSS1780 family membrane protein [Rhodocyclaceae bacterium]